MQREGPESSNVVKLFKQATSLLFRKRILKKSFFLLAQVAMNSKNQPIESLWNAGNLEFPNAQSVPRLWDGGALWVTSCLSFCGGFEWLLLWHLATGFQFWDLCFQHFSYCCLLPRHVWFPAVADHFHGAGLEFINLDLTGTSMYIYMHAHRSHYA